MTITKFENQSIPKDGFSHKFKQSGKIKCSLKTGGVKVKTFNKNVTLAFSPIGSLVAVEDDKPANDATEWTVTVTRESADKDASVTLEIPLK